MYTDRQIEALKVVQAAVKKYNAKKIAEVLNISTGTIYADIDPKSIGRRTNKLGFLDWLVILEETKDLTSLDLVNHQFNRLSLAIPNTEGHTTIESWMAHCASIAKESGEAVAELAEAIVDGQMENHELERCEKQTIDALEAFGCLYLKIKECRACRAN
ncbi:phage regulatory CII family protein [Desulfosediminicola sp.]|uniref:phage regulatory CII family protein n=1 Tax=Desulfosediminicola sp. TaxID=2886825 RepID=UPI003AF2922A